MTKVPSESRTFHSVRCDRGRSGESTLRPLGVSFSGYSSGITPASQTRPGGHHPPISSPQSLAARNAAWSTPVCPPETILINTFAGLTRSTWRATLVMQVSRPPARLPVQADSQQANSRYESDNEQGLHNARKRLVGQGPLDLKPRRNEPDQAKNVQADGKPYHFGGVILIRGDEETPQENEEQIKGETKKRNIAWHRFFYSSWHS